MTRAVTVLASMVIVLSGCASSNTRGGDVTTGRSLIVSAAASLTEAFTEIGDAFEGEEPSVTVRFNFGPSDGLAAQIEEGAPVDVFASASPAWMDAVQHEGPGVSDRTDFARNELAVIVPAGNPAGIRALDDLTLDGVSLVLAAQGVPAGDYARRVLHDTGLADAALANLVSNEEDVKGVVTKVLSGDADAGIAYVTDVTPAVANRIELVPIPDDLDVTATYPIAVVSSSQEADLAQRFVDFVLGDGQQILAGYGFLPVP